MVLAAGRPGRDVTASFGIISAVKHGWRSWEGGGGGARIDQVMRLDLAIYDGFSGGPLVDSSGAVLGMNNSALARGTPMALPAAAVDRVLNELLQRGHVRRPFIGVAVQPVMVPASVARRHGLSGDTTLLVLSIGDGSPADRGGLMVGDALIEANGKALAHPADLLDVLAGVAEGAALEFKVLRGGVLQSLSVTPTDRGAAE
jgi:S1-C subfamily serine protease